MEDTPRVGVRGPTARVTRGADHVAIELDLAGFASNELDVAVAGSDVTIRGHGANGVGAALRAQAPAWRQKGGDPK